HHIGSRRRTRRSRRSAAFDSHLSRSDPGAAAREVAAIAERRARSHGSRATQRYRADDPSIPRIRNAAGRIADITVFAAQEKSAAATHLQRESLSSLSLRLERAAIDY